MSGEEGTIRKISSPVDFRVIGIILAIAIGLQLGLYVIWNEDMGFGIFNLPYSLGSASAAVASFVVAYRYWGSSIFGKSYFSLGIAFLLLLLGDITYIYFDWILEIDPYPSIADVFLLAYYPFVIFHVARNVTYFKRSIDWATKGFLIAIAAIIIFIFGFFSLTDLGEASFDFYFGLASVVPGAVIFCLAILGVVVFRQSVLGTAWLLLAMGILIFTATDVWYYYSELFGQYDTLHPTNALWLLGHLIIVYGLYKHQKAI